MRGFELTSNPDVAGVFARYPDHVRPKLERLRALVLEAANEVPGLTHLEETLKWGEPSYVAKKGSTIRMDWKPRAPERYALYFKCTSKLVPTFREVFGDRLSFEGDRAIVFGLDDELPEAELAQCIAAALRYHTVKGLPRLGLRSPA